MVIAMQMTSNGLTRPVLPEYNESNFFQVQNGLVWKKTIHHFN